VKVPRTKETKRVSLLTTQNMASTT